MTKLSILLIFIFCLSSYAQNNRIRTKNENTIKKSIHLSKIQLINQANKIVSFKYPDFEFNPLLYEITVWKNSKKTTVSYRRIIRFTPLDKKDIDLFYDFEVNLTEQSVFPFDTWGTDKFYFPTVEDKEKIDFIIEAFGLPKLGFDNTIIEDADLYRINIDNDTSFGSYSIDKITGEELIHYRIQGSYEPIPTDAFSQLIEVDPLIEIK